MIGIPLLSYILNSPLAVRKDAGASSHTCIVFEGDRRVLGDVPNTLSIYVR